MKVLFSLLGIWLKNKIEIRVKNEKENKNKN
jgi:hypothetical protein